MEPEEELPCRSLSKESVHFSGILNVGSVLSLSAEAETIPEERISAGSRKTEAVRRLLIERIPETMNHVNGTMRIPVTKRGKAFFMA